MCNGITVFAPAKINIGLEVFPKRQDCYHDIKSIFTVVNLCDELTVNLTGQKNSCIVECENFALPEENTFTKAYKAFCVLTGVCQGVCVKLVKHIPAGGGLGGGSSDASSFIQSLDILFDTHLSETSLDEISSQVGSDVFFFTRALYSGCKNFTAVVQGRGDKVTQIQGRDDLHVLLVFPGVSVSTKEAYAWVDEAHQKQGKLWQDADGDIRSYVEEFNKPVRKWFFQNDFTAPVTAHFGEIALALQALRQCDADFVDMSGSGSSVFGIFKDVEKAQAAFQILSENWHAALV
ncbi:MAG: 4-(cytidine 5'-diphospho)-2-C-methyl-D-erythritol kinase [Treponema sp.]|nr:4-(cytidine 5'-diphospho)-2-C-methyl-D-erythritol kinase [Treponema sp.]